MPGPREIKQQLQETQEELRIAKGRLQRLGVCPHHETPEFGCEPCANIVAKDGPAQRPRSTTAVDTKGVMATDAVQTADGADKT